MPASSFSSRVVRRYFLYLFLSLLAIGILLLRIAYAHGYNRGMDQGIALGRNEGIEIGTEYMRTAQPIGNLVSGKRYYVHYVSAWNERGEKLALLSPADSLQKFEIFAGEIGFIEPGKKYTVRPSGLLAESRR